MGTLGRLVFAVSLPLLAQQKEVRPVPAEPRPVEAPKPIAPKPPLPVAVPAAPTQDGDRIDKRRERMKDRDAEIDRMMREKAKQQQH